LDHPDTLNADLPTLLFGHAADLQAYNTTATQYHQGLATANTSINTAGIQGQLPPTAEFDYSVMASGLPLTETDQDQMAFQPLPSAERLPKFSSLGILFKNAAEVEVYLQQTQ
jgi:hypothetical protein